MGGTFMDWRIIVYRLSPATGRFWPLTVSLGTILVSVSSRYDCDHFLTTFSEFKKNNCSPFSIQTSHDLDLWPMATVDPHMSEPHSSELPEQGKGHQLQKKNNKKIILYWTRQPVRICEGLLYSIVTDIQTSVAHVQKQCVIITATHVAKLSYPRILLTLLDLATSQSCIGAECVQPAEDNPQNWHGSDHILSPGFTEATAVRFWGRRLTTNHQNLHLKQPTCLLLPYPNVMNKGWSGYARELCNHSRWQFVAVRNFADNYGENKCEITDTIRTWFFMLKL